jgi:hypothetical protein
VILSKLSLEATARAAEFVRTLLERRSPRGERTPGRPPKHAGRAAVNIARVVGCAGLGDAEQKLIERLLDRGAQAAADVAAPPEARRSPQLQGRTFQRVLDAVEKIEAGSRDRLLEHLGLGPASAEAVRKYKRSLREPDWLRPADASTVSLLFPAMFPEKHRVPAPASFAYAKREDRRGRPFRLGVKRRQRPATKREIPAQYAAMLEQIVPGGLPDWCLEEIESFQREMLDRKHDPRRVRLGLYRFFGPFYAWQRTGHVERGWHQLTRDEQRQAVRAGLDVERAWLGLGRVASPPAPGGATRRSTRTAALRR